MRSHCLTRRTQRVTLLSQIGWWHKMTIREHWGKSQVPHQLLTGPSKMWVTHIGKRKLKTGPRKNNGKKAETTDEPVLGNDESTPSPDERRSPPYQESNLSTSASSDDDDRDDGGYRIEPPQPTIQFTGVKYRQIHLYSSHIIFLISLTHALLFSGESHYTHATQDMGHGAPHS
jgi:hypothetical protein